MAKVMISIPDELLERIDREAKRVESTRSGLLQRAALRELGRPDPKKLDTALARGRSALTGTGRFDAAKLIREERDRLEERDRSRL